MPSDQEPTIAGEKNKRKKRWEVVVTCFILILVVFEFSSSPTRALSQAYHNRAACDTLPLNILNTHSLTPNTTTDQSLEIRNVHPNVTTINVTDSPPKMYACDLHSNLMSQLIAFFQAVLPEYELVNLASTGEGARGGGPWRAWRETTGNDYDVFITSIQGLCSQVTTKWLLQAFHGKLIMGSGESDNPPSKMRDFFFIAGPVPQDSDQMMRVYYLQYVWWKVFRLELDVLSPEVLTGLLPRPRNDGQHFLIYAASNCVPFRERAFRHFATLGHVHYGGRCRGKLPDSENVTKFVNRVNVGNWEDNIMIYHNFRFCLVMEHSGQAGYVTEKILLAFAGGCIPIYFGTLDIFDLFNRDAFIFCDSTNPQLAVAHVAHLEANKSAYEAMLSAPMLADGNRTLEKYFSITDDIGNGKLKARIRERLGLNMYVFEK